MGCLSCPHCSFPEAIMTGHCHLCHPLCWYINPLNWSVPGQDHRLFPSLWGAKSDCHIFSSDCCISSSKLHSLSINPAVNSPSDNQSRRPKVTEYLLCAGCHARQAAPLGRQPDSRARNQGNQPGKPIRHFGERPGRSWWSLDEKRQLRELKKGQMLSCLAWWSLQLIPSESHEGGVEKACRSAGESSGSYGLSSPHQGVFSLRPALPKHGTL